MVPQPSHDQSEIGASPHKLCLVIFWRPRIPLRLYGKICVDWWGVVHTQVCVYTNSGEEILGFTKFSVGSLSQEKSKTATLSEVQDIVQNLNPSNHSLEHRSLTYRHRSGLPCPAVWRLPSLRSCPHPALGQGHPGRRGCAVSPGGRDWEYRALLWGHWGRKRFPRPDLNVLRFRLTSGMLASCTRT